MTVSRPSATADVAPVTVQFSVFTSNVQATAASKALLRLFCVTVASSVTTDCAMAVSEPTSVCLTDSTCADKSSIRPLASFTKPSRSERTVSRASASALSAETSAPFTSSTYARTDVMSPPCPSSCSCKSALTLSRASASALSAPMRIWRSSLMSASSRAVLATTTPSKLSLTRAHNPFSSIFTSIGRE